MGVCWDWSRDIKATEKQSEQWGKWSMVKSGQKLWSRCGGDLTLTLSEAGNHRRLLSREVMCSDFHLKSFLT